MNRELMEKLRCGNLFHLTAALSFALLLVAAITKWADFWPLSIIEAGLGVYLLVGNRSRVAMLSTSLFLVFSLWNIWAILNSAPSCGCFGDLKVSPWVTGSIDLSMSVTWAIVLVLSREDRNRHAPKTYAQLRYMRLSDCYLPISGLLAFVAIAGLSLIAGHQSSDVDRAKVAQNIKQVLRDEGLIGEGNGIRTGLIINPECSVCNRLVSDSFDAIQFVVVVDDAYHPPRSMIRVVNWKYPGVQVAFPTLVITSGESIELISQKPVIKAVLARDFGM